MQFDINKEVRDYKETLFFGLNLRQCVCSALAIIVAIVLYFSLKSRLSNEPLSWVCMLGAAPFAAMGFFKYQGMTAEQFAMNWVYTVLLEPKCFPFQILQLPANNHILCQRPTCKHCSAYSRPVLSRVQFQYLLPYLYQHLFSHLYLHPNLRPHRYQ